MSIPRMELQAAVLGSRLASAIVSGHTILINKRVFWSDSKTVLCWLRGDPKRFRQFVSLRIGEILENTMVNEWKWIPTNENVADDATKWQSVPDVGPKGRWFNGPGFLLLPEASWPVETNQTKLKVDDDELRPCLTHTSVPKSLSMINVDRFSSWRRLLRTQAFVVVVFKSFVNKNQKPYGPITSSEISEAENCLFIAAQNDEFATEIETLHKNVGKPLADQVNIKRTCKIFNLSPYVDEGGMLRVNGRIDVAVGTFD